MNGTNVYYGRWKDCVQNVYRKHWRTPKEIESMGFTGYKRGERIIAMVQFSKSVAEWKNYIASKDAPYSKENLIKFNSEKDRKRALNWLYTLEETNAAGTA